MDQIAAGFGESAATAHRLLDELFEFALKESEGKVDLWSLNSHLKDLRKSSFYKAILKNSPQIQLQVILDVLRRADDSFLGFLENTFLDRDPSLFYRTVPFHLANHLLCDLIYPDLPYTEADVCFLLDESIITKMDSLGRFHILDLHDPFNLGDRILKLIHKFTQQHELTAPITERLAALKRHAKYYYWGDAKKLHRHIDQLLLEPGGFELGDEWGNQVIADLRTISDLEQTGWKSLLSHAQDSDKSEPTAKWLKAAEERLVTVGPEVVKAKLLLWFGWMQEVKVDYQLRDRNAAILKGLVWYCHFFSDEETLRGVAGLADACFKKIPGIGPRSLRVGNACVYILSSANNLYGVAQLDRLRQSIKNRTVLKQLEKAFVRAAEKTGLSQEDLVELAIPTFNLDETGSLRQTLGSFTAEVKLSGSNTVTLTWQTEHGKLQKSVPAEVKRDYAEDLKALKRLPTEIPKLLQAQTRRIESFYLNPRTWSYATWHDRYLAHPILGHLAKRLIWQFETGDRILTGIWHDGKLVDHTGRSLILEEQAQVQLWHPIHATVETVVGWRTWLEEHTITQPFKQAHREIYLLTDAELETDTYSNRFAAHIIKQHQFNALCSDRGWQYTLQGGFDSHNTPTLSLPQWNLLAEFWVDAVGEEMSESYIYLYLSTDQVRFYNTHREPLRLVEVPALVFSEVMRNVDLFVGVCSIGNDPNWRDRGDQVGYQDYWWNYSFGDLSISAQVRREVLKRLLLKLKIASQCELTETFLIVKGKLRTYKIHLGSGNILMEPNSQYLCIVPDRTGKTSNVFLPFEGDSTLSLILSKALLLAEDQAIKDPSILSQIQAGIL